MCPSRGTDTTCLENGKCYISSLRPSLDLSFLPQFAYAMHRIGNSRIEVGLPKYAESLNKQQHSMPRSWDTSVPSIPLAQPLDACKSGQLATHPSRWSYPTPCAWKTTLPVPPPSKRSASQMPPPETNPARKTPTWTASSAKTFPRRARFGKWGRPLQPFWLPPRASFPSTNTMWRSNWRQSPETATHNPNT